MTLAQFTSQSSDRLINAFGGCFVLGFIVIAILLLFDVWRLNRSEEVKLLWTLVLCLIPIVGVVLYLCVGRRANDPGSSDRLP